MICDMRLGLAVAVLVVLAVSSVGNASQIIYDNSSNPAPGTAAGYTPDGFWPFDAYEYDPAGDEITLASDTTARTIIRFEMYLSSVGPTTINNLTLSFYYNDSTSPLDNRGAPGTMFWLSDPVRVEVNGPRTVVFDVPNIVTEHETFTWVATADSGTAGLVTFDPPTKGSSENYFWDHDPSGRWFNQNFENDPAASFGATITAVPEPITAMVMLLGGMALSLRRRARG